MRTTVEIDDDLIRRLREQAHRDGTSLREKLNAALCKGLAERHGARTPRRYKCPSLAMGHPVAPAIDLDKALSIAGALEDAEIARELELGK